jgi:hypothetical protein
MEKKQKIISIHQPAYIPWLGYFDKIAKSDTHIILDDVEYSKNNLFNRNIINTANGWLWLTIPVKYKNKTPINQIKIDNSKKWRKKHWKSIELNYGKAPFFNKYSENFKIIYEKEWENLADFVLEINKEILNILNIKTKLIKSSNIKTYGSKNEKLLNICELTNATTYLTGKGAKDPRYGAYLEEELFSKNNIKINYQEFKNPEYKKINKEFIPNLEKNDMSSLSILDILFTLGTKKIKEYLKNDN